MDLPNSVIKMMAEMERRMDSGEIQFVMFEGNRLPITESLIKEFGLEPGQTINKVIFDAMAEFAKDALIRDIIGKVAEDRKVRTSEAMTAAYSDNTSKPMETSEPGTSNNVDTSASLNLKFNVDTASASILNFNNKEI